MVMVVTAHDGPRQPWDRFRGVANLKEQADVRDHIGRWFGWVRALFAPVPPVQFVFPAAVGSPPVRVAEPDRGAPVDGDAVALVRPYVVAHERRKQRQRRRALVLATVGIDVGPRVVHGVGVPR